MNSISLLPKSIKSSKNKPPVYRLLTITLIILIITSLIPNAVLVIHTTKINNKLKILKEQRKAIETYLKDNDDVLATQAEINRLQGIVEKAMGSVPDWATIITDIDNSRSKDIINHIVKGSHTESGGVITVNGFVGSHLQLKNYMDRLNDLALVNDVDLSYVRQYDSDDNNSQLEFQIVVFLFQGNQFKIDDK